MQVQVGPWKFNVRRSPEGMRILVPVNGKPASDHAFRWAGQLARQARASLYAVYVIELPLEFPLGSAEASGRQQQGEDILSRIEAIAAAERCPVNATLMESRSAGPAIVQEAEERRANLLVVGLPWQRRAGADLLGETPAYILKNAPCQTLFSREPAPVAARQREIRRG